MTRLGWPASLTKMPMVMIGASFSSKKMMFVEPLAFGWRMTERSFCAAASTTVESPIAMVLKDFPMLNVETTPSVRSTLASTLQQVCGAAPDGSGLVPFLITLWADTTVGIAAARDVARTIRYAHGAPSLAAMSDSFHD